MDDVGVVHQIESSPTSRDSFTNHVYPFKTLPLIKSHVHPQFAIVAIGKLLYTPSIVTKPLPDKLLDEFPTVKKVYELYGTWASAAGTPEFLELCLGDKSYAPLPKDEVDELASESDGDSTATAPRRIRERRPTQGIAQKLGTLQFRGNLLNEQRIHPRLARNVPVSQSHCFLLNPERIACELGNVDALGIGEQAVQQMVRELPAIPSVGRHRGSFPILGPFRC